MNSTPDDLEAEEPPASAPERTAPAPREFDGVSVDAAGPNAADGAVDPADTALEPTSVDPVPAPLDPDPALIEARDVALVALREFTDERTIGEPAGYRVESDGVVSLLFANRMAGYPGWFWTVSVARTEGEAPTVLETELLPGDGALLAPEWVPWAVRLADYEAHQSAAAVEDAGDDGSDEGVLEGDDFDDVDDLDAADFDEDGSPILHSGDVDGVDIDNYDDDDENTDDEDSDDDDEDDEDADDEDADDEDSDDEDDEDEDEDDEDVSDDDSDDSDEDDELDDELDDDAFLAVERREPRERF